MKPTVLITHAIPKEGLEALFAKAEVLYPETPAFSKAELIAAAPRLDAVLSVGPLDADFFEATQKLQIVSNYGAGYDAIDISAATRRGVPVATIPETVAAPTAELAFGLLLAVSRRIGDLSSGMREGKPENFFGIGIHMGHSLEGRNLGILGMGSIGGRLSKMAQAVGMRVYYHNRNPLPPERENGATYLPFAELLAKSDALSLHFPLTESTRGRIGREELSLLPKGAILINTARGGVMDYEALSDALESGALFGAGLDVFPDEPHVPKRLLSLPNVVLTPHFGSNTFEARKAMAQAASAHILRALEGMPPEHPVNPEVYAKDGR